MRASTACKPERSRCNDGDAQLTPSCVQQRRSLKTHPENEEHEILAQASSTRALVRTRTHERARPGTNECPSYQATAAMATPAEEKVPRRWKPSVERNSNSNNSNSNSNSNSNERSHTRAFEFPNARARRSGRQGRPRPSSAIPSPTNQRGNPDRGPTSGLTNIRCRLSSESPSERAEHAPEFPSASATVFPDRRRDPRARNRPLAARPAKKCFRADSRP